MPEFYRLDMPKEEINKTLLTAVLEAQPVVAGNFAAFTKDGQIIDSEKSAADFAQAPLAKDLTLYVSTTGSDSNDGLSAGTAKRTIQAAIDAVPKNLDGHVVWINIAPGVYPEQVIVWGYLAGAMRLLGNTESPDLTVVNQFSVHGCSGRVRIEGMTITTVEIYDARLCMIQFCMLGPTETWAVASQNSHIVLYSVNFTFCAKAVTLGYASQLSAGAVKGTGNTVGVSVATGDGYPMLVMMSNCNWGAETEIVKGYHSIVFKDGVQI